MTSVILSFGGVFRLLFAIARCLCFICRRSGIGTIRAIGVCLLGAGWYWIGGQ
jgi:hypothetical protein